MTTKIQSTSVKAERSNATYRIGVLLAAIAVGVVLTGGAMRLNALRLTNTEAVIVEPLPFGPGWAADYGITHKAAVDPFTKLPFGPGWAANYGIESSYDLPFGPEVAATYGAGYNTTLPFGPGWAATYGRPGVNGLPFGPGWAATYGIPAR